MPKNYKKVPGKILAKIQGFPDDDLLVACVRRMTKADIEDRAHLNLRLENNVLLVPTTATPSAKMGKYSDANLNGKEVVRRDLPKTTKSVVVQAPNWRGSGTHDVWQTREVFVRDFIAPKEVTLSLELLDGPHDGSTFTLKFTIDEVLNRKSADFEAELLYNLNILQENVGVVDVFPSRATRDDYTLTIRLNWEILPPGDLDNVIGRMLQGRRPVSPQQRAAEEHHARPP